MREELQPFTLEISREGPGLFVVSLGGEVDIANSAELERRLDEIEADGPFAVVVDLSALRFIDSSGIRALIVAARALESRGGRVTLAAPNPHVERVFGTVHLDEVVRVAGSLEEALADDGAASRDAD